MEEVESIYRASIFGVSMGMLINDNDAVNYTIDENVMGFDQFVVNTEWTD